MAQVIRGLTLASAAAGAAWWIAGAQFPAENLQSHPPAIQYQPVRTAENGAPAPAAHSLQRPAPALTGYTQAASDAHSNSEMWNAVIGSTGLTAQWLQSHGFTPGSKALEQLHALLNGNTAITSTGTGVKHIAFGPQGSTPHVTTDGAPTLSTHERYVSATLPTGGMAGDSVLLRWRNMSDNQIMDISAQTLPSGTDSAMPLWMYSPSDWAPGRYRVEVLTPNADLALQAAGEFVIATSESSVTSFSYHATAQQLSGSP